MRILHTSDWHLGHTLHEVGREFEHCSFLNWLLAQLREREVDALLIAGDVFDTANPSASAQELWYRFLASALQARPGLQIVVIAGNHDSAARLEAPDQLLRHFHIRVVGSLPRKPDGAFDPEGVLVRLRDRGGMERAIIIAMPFLRLGDLPVLEENGGELEDPAVKGVQSLYAQALEAARPLGLPVLAMGHCYMASGSLSELSERKVLGGNQHALPLDIFPRDVAYVALGHLHLAQAMDGGRVRYCGSPIPLAISERHYRHAVTLLELGEDGGLRQEEIRIPRAVPLLRVPDRGYLSLEELLQALKTLPTGEVPPQDGFPLAPGASPRPFLEVGVRLDKPEAQLRTAIEAALEGKGYALARIDIARTGSGQALADGHPVHGLREMSVEDVFLKKWSSTFESDVSQKHLEALHELIDQVGQELA